jgi:hypothetical protein
VSDVTLVFENAEHGANGGIARRIGKFAANIGSVRPSKPIQHIQNLALSPAEVYW